MADRNSLIRALFSPTSSLHLVDSPTVKANDGDCHDCFSLSVSHLVSLLLFLGHVPSSGSLIFFCIF